MAHQAGFDNVVASLGHGAHAGPGRARSPATPKKVALAYDVDPAGQSAGTFGVTELNNLISEVQGGRPRRGVGLTDVGVVRLPEGKDPDEVIRESPDPWREAVRTPDPILDLPHRLPRLAGRRPHAGGAQAARRRGPADAPQGRRPDGPRHLPPAARPALDGERADAARGAPPARRMRGARSARRAAAGRPSAASTPAPGSRSTRSVRPPEPVSPEEVVESITPVEHELLRLLLLAARPAGTGRGRAPARGAALDRRPASCTRRSSRTGDGERRPPATPTARAASSAAASSRRSTRRPARSRSRCMRSTGPDPREPAVAARSSTTSTSACSPSRPTGSRSGSTGTRRSRPRPSSATTARRWLGSSTEERQINEARRSLDRRIEQTRLLTRPTTTAAPATAGRA